MEANQNQGQNISQNITETVQTSAKPQNFSYFDIFVLTFSLCIYIVDIVTDCVIGTQYILAGHIEWGLMTLSLSLFPLFVTQCISIRWYQVDGIPITLNATVLHCTMLGIVHRYFLCLDSGLKSRKENSAESIQRLHHHQSSICLLRLFETFLESAPQLLLQLYIMHELGSWHPWTGLCAIASLVSLAWGMASYVRTMRTALEDKALISWTGLLLQALWRTGTVFARIMALLLCASVLHAWFFLAFGLHWLGMFVWIVQQKTDLCISAWEERVYNVIVGVIYCFCFFNLKEGQTRRRALIYYTIIAFENSACLIVFLRFADPHSNHQWFHTAAPIIIVAGTVIGHTSQLIYYRWFHPSGPIKAGPLDIRLGTRKETKEPGTTSSAANPNTFGGTLRTLKYVNHLARKISGVSLPSLAENTNSAPPVTPESPAIPVPAETYSGISTIPVSEVEVIDESLGESPPKPQKTKNFSVSDSKLIPKKPLDSNIALLMRKSKSDALILYRLEPNDDTSSVCTSVHDYENMPIININRSDWGIRHWQTYSDIEASCHDDSTYRERELLETTASSSDTEICPVVVPSKPSVNEAIAHLKSLAHHGHNIYQPGPENDSTGLYECVWMEGSSKNGVLVVPRQYAEIFKTKPHIPHDLSTITELSEPSSCKSSLVDTVDVEEPGNPLTYMEVSFLSRLRELDNEDKSTKPRRQFSILRDRFEDVGNMNQSANKENQPIKLKSPVTSPIRRSTLSPSSRVFAS